MNYPEKGKPLPLWGNSKPCIGCGHCCRVRTCGFADWDEAKHQCSALVDKGDGSFGCGIYDKIINGDDPSWTMAPAFGAGCCSGLNPDRFLLEQKKEGKV